MKKRMMTKKKIQRAFKSDHEDTLALAYDHECTTRLQKQPHGFAYVDSKLSFCEMFLVAKEANVKQSLRSTGVQKSNPVCHDFLEPSFSWVKKRKLNRKKFGPYALARFKGRGRGGRGRGGRGRGGRGRNKRKKKPVQAKGIVHIRSTFNNTLFTLRSLKGRVLGATSAGRCGFKGSRKSTPYAARRAAQTAGRKSLERHLKHVKVYLNGPGAGRETAIRGLMDVGLKITLIRDVTRLPHNGCRPPKKRRV